MSDRQDSRQVRWRGPAHKDVIGYCQEISVGPGDELQVKVSCVLPSFDVDVVRLQHGAEDAPGPGMKETAHSSSANGRYPGRHQPINLGSFMRVDAPHELASLVSFSCSAWIKPTVCGEGHRGIVSGWCEATGSGFAMLLGDAGDLELWVGDGNAVFDRVSTGIPLLPHQWAFVAVSVDLVEGSAILLQRPERRWPGVDSWATCCVAVACRAVGDADVPLLVAAIGRADAPGHYFDGKIEAPVLRRRALSSAELNMSSEVGITSPPPDDVIAAWDFSVGIHTRNVTDQSSNGFHGVLVNMPARAVTGCRWTGHQTDWTQAPEQYAAIHFHSDDLEDAGWDTDLVVPIDETYPSGVYAVRLRAGDCEDRIPFVVRPGRNSPRARIAVLLPTLTYQAYANSRVFGGSAAKIEQAEDEYMSQHGLRGLYDYHRDGSPSYYASRLQPSTNRPNYYAQHLAAPARLSSDLCLIDWLMEQDIEHDIITDEDLHHEGADLLRHYRVVITGSHPEYWTEHMGVAMEEYLNQAGNLAYLGGECCYWVTTLHSGNTAVMEVRRAEGGTRTQSAQPGEYHHSSTGELGGLWRFRGRTAHSLVGVGFTAWGPEQGTGYRRLPDSHDPRASFIFEGIGADEVIGDFGIVLGGAAGYEIDRLDYSLGTPPHALLLATSAGAHSSAYVPATEEILDAATMDAVASQCVRADMVFFETGRGGAVFSTGSITWTGSLSHNVYDNNVSTITHNVLTRFASDDPFPEAPVAC